MTMAIQTEPGSKHRGVSLFIVDTDLPGVSVSRKLDKLGMRASDTAEIVLDDVRVPAGNLLGGEPGQGFAQMAWQLQYERLSGAAQSIGQGLDVLEQTIAYARERHAFGRPLAANQVIAHLLADAATELEAARALTYDTIWRVQQGEYPVAEISMAKKYAAQVQNRLVDACLQVYGGAGYLNETPVSRLVARRAAPAHRCRHRPDHERGHRQAARHHRLTDQAPAGTRSTKVVTIRGVRSIASRRPRRSTSRRRGSVGRSSASGRRLAERAPVHLRHRRATMTRSARPPLAVMSITCGVASRSTSNTALQRVHSK